MYSRLSFGTAAARSLGLNVATSASSLFDAEVRIGRLTSVLTCRRGPTGPSGFYCSGKLAPPVSLGTPSHPVAAMPRHAAPCQRHATPCSLSTAQSATYLPDNVLRLAVLIPTRASSPGKRASIGAVALAAAAVNDPAASVLSGKKLEYVVTSVRCDSSDATAAVSRMLEQGPVNAVIGPDCSAACESSAFLTAGRNIAQISYSCLSAVLSDKEKYPTVHSLLPTVRTALSQPPFACMPPHSPEKRQLPSLGEIARMALLG